MATTKKTITSTPPTTHELEFLYIDEEVFSAICTALVLEDPEDAESAVVGGHFVIFGLNGEGATYRTNVPLFTTLKDSSGVLCYYDTEDTATSVDSAATV